MYRQCLNLSRRIRLDERRGRVWALEGRRRPPTRCRCVPALLEGRLLPLAPRPTWKEFSGLAPSRRPASSRARRRGDAQPCDLDGAELKPKQRTLASTDNALLQLPRGPAVADARRNSHSMIEQAVAPVAARMMGVGVERSQHGGGGGRGEAVHEDALTNGDWIDQLRPAHAARRLLAWLIITRSTRSWTEGQKVGKAHA